MSHLLERTIDLELVPLKIFDEANITISLRRTYTTSPLEYYSEHKSENIKDILKTLPEEYNAAFTRIISKFENLGIVIPKEILNISDFIERRKKVNSLSRIVCPFEQICFKGFSSDNYKKIYKLHLARSVGSELYIHNLYLNDEFMAGEVKEKIFDGFMNNIINYATINGYMKLFTIVKEKDPLFEKFFHEDKEYKNNYINAIALKKDLNPKKPNIFQ